MSESREEILANFQACTGIQDIGEALEHLETSSWILVDAVNRAIPPDNPQGGVDPTAQRVSPPPNIVQGSDSQPIVIDDDSPIFPPRLPAGFPQMSGMPPPPFPQMDTPLQNTFASFLNAGGVDGTAGGSGMMAGSSGMMAGGSGLMAGSGRQMAGVSLASDFLPLGPAQRSRMLELNVEYRDRMINLKVPDNQTIQVVKDLLQAETSVPPCQQRIRGWAGNSPFPPADRRLLSELNLPKENFLYLLTPELPAPVLPDPFQNKEEEEDSEDKIVLNITDLSNNKTYNLTFSSSRQLSSVRRDVATVTNIPVFRQQWTGLPDASQDDLSLAQCGVVNNSALTVTQALTRPDLNMPIVVDDDIESDAEEDDDYQDAPDHMDDDDIFTQPSRSGIEPLLPDDFGDEALAGIKFAEEFTNRYGQPSPHFFPGSLDDALAESCNKRGSENKMLALYLHHDSSVLTNVFCTQVLCSDAVIGLMMENFVTWGWDLTFQKNKQRLLDMINRHFGTVAANTLRNFEIEKFPLVILIAKLRGNLEILQIIHGNTTLAEFMTEVLSASENYNQQVGVERREEQERTERNYVKDEQEAAFREAELLDQVKEKERADAVEEAQMQAQIDEAKRRSEVEAKESEERRRREEAEAAAEVLPAEPAQDDQKPQANIRFRTPSETLTRRFYATDTLGTILLYLASVGYRPAEYKILSSWPRRDISVLDRTSSLQTLKLCPQETLTLEAHTSADSDSD